MKLVAMILGQETGDQKIIMNIISVMKLRDPDLDPVACLMPQQTLYATVRLETYASVPSLHAPDLVNH
jgi:hypothetical protein